MSEHDQKPLLIRQSIKEALNWPAQPKQATQVLAKCISRNSYQPYDKFLDIAQSKFVRYHVAKWQIQLVCRLGISKIHTI